MLGLLDRRTTAEGCGNTQRRGVAAPAAPAVPVVGALPRQGERGWDSALHALLGCLRWPGRRVSPSPPQVHAISVDESVSFAACGRDAGLKTGAPGVGSPTKMPPPSVVAPCTSPSRSDFRALAKQREPDSGPAGNPRRLRHPGVHLPPDREPRPGVPHGIGRRRRERRPIFVSGIEATSHCREPGKPRSSAAICATAGPKPPRARIPCRRSGTCFKTWSPPTSRVCPPSTAVSSAIWPTTRYGASSVSRKASRTRWVFPMPRSCWPTTCWSSTAPAT